MLRILISLHTLVECIVIFSTPVEQIYQMEVEDIYQAQITKIALCPKWEQFYDKSEI